MDLAIVKGETDESLELIKDMPLITQEDFDWFTDLVKDVSAKYKALEELRKSLTKPILESKANVDNRFKPVLGALEALEKLLKDKIAGYTLAQQKARVEVMQASAALYQAGGTPTAIIPEPAQAKGITVRELWDFEVVDENALPREYMTPDPKKIRKAIWYADTPKTPPRPIPGVRFFLKSSVTVRS